MLEGEQFARAAETGLNLVGDQQRVVFAAKIGDPGEVALGRNDDPALTLDRFDQHADHVGVHRLADRLEITVRQHRETRRERPVTVLVLRLVGEADNRRGAAVEVAGKDEDLGLAVRNTLDLVAPLPRRLDRRLNGFRARIHRQHPLVPGHVVDFFVQRTELVRTEGP